MPHLIESPSWLMLLKASGQAAVLIVLVLAAQYALGRRLNPRWRHGLWLLVVLRLALPWTIPSPVSLFNFLSFSKASEALVSLPAASDAPGFPVLQPPATAREERPAGQPAASSPSAAPGWRVNFSWLPLAWVAGVCTLALCMGWNYSRLRRAVAWRRPLTDEAVLNLLEDCKQCMGVRVPITLVETPAVDGPCLFGFLRPRLLLPAGFTRGFSLDELRFVFLHELGHVKRHDIPLGWLMAWLQILHWFNPLVWLAFSRMRVDRELACDALALSYAPEQDNKPYGRTMVKLLENFGRSLRLPSLAGILEDKQQMKERIIMIAKFHKSNRGLAVAASLFIGLGLLTLTDAQTQDNTPGHNHAPAGPADTRLGSKVKYASERASVQDIVQSLAEQAGLRYDWQKSFDQTDPLCRQWVRNLAIEGKTCNEALEQVLKPVGLRYTLEDGVLVLSRQDEGTQPPELDASKGVWVVRFEPVDGFSPRTPGEFLQRIHIYSGQDGEIGYFRTKKEGDKLIGSFLASDGEQLKAALAKVAGLKVVSVEKLTQEQLAEYEKSPQESLTADAGDKWDEQQQLTMAEGGNKWAAYQLWESYYRGKNAVKTDPAKAEKWLREFVQDVWIVKFEPVNDFAPASPEAYLLRIDQYAHVYSGQTEIGTSGFFRTTKKGGKLLGSFLSNYPDQLKAALAKVPGLKVTSVEKITPEKFIKYDQSPQESL